MMELNTAEKQIKNIDISIVIPVYNREDCLLRTLKSVLEQTYRPLQLILIDNASTDNSLKICREFQEKYCSEDFSVVVEIENKAGAAYARNCGLTLCESKFVYFFDSDDEMSADFISVVLKELNRKELDILAVKTNIVKRTGSKRIRDCFYTDSPVDQILISMLTTVSMVFNTSFLKSLGGWNVNLLTWDDWELGVRVLLSHPRLKWLRNKVFHQIYIHDNSITGSCFSSSYKWLMKALEAVKRDIELCDYEYGEKKRMLFALYFRQIVLAGVLYREKSIGKSRDCWEKAQLIIVPNKFRKGMARLLFLYTAHGGRGGWRIANFIS